MVEYEALLIVKSQMLDFMINSGIIINSKFKLEHCLLNWSKYELVFYTESNERVSYKIFDGYQVEEITINFGYESAFMEIGK